MRRPLLPGKARPLVFAHRGLSALAPENSLAAFRLARDRGIPGIEFDVHLSADGRLVVIHDDFTGRVAPASVAVSGSPKGYEVELTSYEILKNLDIGSWKSPAFAKERPPLLSDIFEEFGSGLYYDIEIKSRTLTNRGLESAIAAEIARFRLTSHCVLSSFNPFALARARAFAPGVPAGIIWGDTTELPWWLRHGEGRWIAGADFLKPDAALLSTGVKPTRKAGAPYFVPWTVDTREDAQHVLALGADGLISNNPPALSL